MSMASPTLRSSSSTDPWPSLSSCATDRCALPSTAEILTGTSKTGARSEAILSPSSIAGASAVEFGNSWRLRSSEAMGGVLGDQGFGVQALGLQRLGQGFGHAAGGGGRIVGGLAVAPVERESGGGRAGLLPDQQLARQAVLLGEDFELAGDLRIGRGGAHDQARGGLHLAGQEA